MIKGVTKKIVEIKSPASDYFERAVLYLKADLPEAKKYEAIKQAGSYLNSVEAEASAYFRRDLRPIVAVLALALGISLTALAAVLIVVTKI